MEQSNEFAAYCMATHIIERFGADFIAHQNDLMQRNAAEDETIRLAWLYAYIRTSGRKPFTPCPLTPRNGYSVLDLGNR